MDTYSHGVNGWDVLGMFLCLMTFITAGLRYATIDVLDRESIFVGATRSTDLLVLAGICLIGAIPLTGGLHTSVLSFIACIGGAERLRYKDTHDTPVGYTFPLSAVPAVIGGVVIFL